MTTSPWPSPVVARSASASGRRPTVGSFVKRKGLLTTVAGLMVLLPGAVAAADAGVLQATSDEPRAFGYTVGDVVSRRIALQVPAGLRLDADSLPRAGARGRALELQRVVLHTSLAGVPDGLRIDYQIFFAPREVRVLEMPPVELRFTGSPRPQTLRIDAWPLTVAPLAPTEPATREGLGELRPDAEPPRLATDALRLRLSVASAAALLLLGYLARVYLVLPGSAQRHRPFGRAWTALKALPAQPEAAQRRAAFERLHAALNETAGQVLFAPQLEGFLARVPRYAPLRAELSKFFAHSRAEFFAGDAGGPVDGRWLAALARRCRDLERGAA